jgi:hypothetical protein
MRLVDDQAKSRAELDDRERLTRDLQAEAEADRKEAARIRADLERRLQLIQAA